MTLVHLCAMQLPLNAEVAVDIHALISRDTPLPYLLGKGKGKGKMWYGAYDGLEFADNVASSDMEASVHDVALVQLGGYGVGYPEYPYHPPYPVHHSIYRSKG
jgi:hypothetical protein